jgi:hypothetical protein
MPMIFAMNGADDFTYFGASANPAVFDLQTALVSLGNAVRDSTLMALATDGLIGPLTTAAVNRALTVHVGPGSAAASLRTGNLTQAAVVSNAAALTAAVQAERARRTGVPGGGPVPQPPQPQAPPSYTPPGLPYVPPTSDLQPIVDTQMSIVKWSAIGLGVVTLAGLAYWLAKRASRPALAGVTVESYVVQGNYGHGWEDVFESEVRSESTANLKLYRANEPQYAFRLINRHSGQSEDARAYNYDLKMRMRDRPFKVGIHGR